MKKVAFTISKIIGNLTPTLSLSVEIKTSWNQIVGKELSELTTFYDAKYTGKNELAVIVKVLSSASIIARYSSSKIIENLSKLTGISKINLIFQNVSFIPKISLHKNETSNIALKETQIIPNKFENLSLKNALESLKTEMKDAA